jgi:uracil DNA glycosylase
LIDKNKHKIIISSHPSPLSVNNKLRNYNSFSDTDHFELINKYLEENNQNKIIWNELFI